MASLSGVNYTKETASPKAKIENGEVFGSVHYLREEYALAGAVLAIGDTISGPMLPKGARVLDAAIKVSATLGTGGIIDLGYQASADGLEAADPNAFVIGADAGGQAVLLKAAIASAALDKKFVSAVRTEAIMTEASSATTGVTISFWIAYVIN